MVARKPPESSKGIKTMRKSATAPRRLYTISSHLVVLFCGKRYGVLAEESTVSAEHMVTVVANDDGTATVTQKRRGKKTVNETWKLVTI
jgi:hypothetical protein